MMNNALANTNTVAGKGSLSLFGVLALTAIAGVFFSFAVYADDYPNGCVSCHVEGSGALDMRINAVLDRLGHGKAADRSKMIPTACDRCHVASGDGPATALRILIHRAHYTEPDVNLFTTQYNGSCLHCHSMDGATGKATIKSGERNWIPVVGGEPITN